MINEVLEAESYLNGQNIRKKECTFRMCYIMAKYFHQKGLEPIDIRKSIFKWGAENNVFILHNVNDIIRMAISDNIPLVDKNIYVSKEDVDNILVRFTTYNSKLCALGILLFAKAHADEDGVFTFSQGDFAKWVGMQQPHVSKCLDELELFDYVEKIYSSGDQTFAWNGRVIGKRIKYKLKVPYANEGEYLLSNNDVRGLYNIIFAKE